MDLSKYSQNKLFTKEFSAEEILNGAVKRKPSPDIKIEYNDEGFAKERLSKVSSAGIHPRILFSPEDIPGIKQRLQNTETGKILLDNLYSRLARTIEDKKSWESEVLKKLENKEYAEAYKLLQEKKRFSYQPDVLYPLMLKAFDCLIFNKVEEGRRVADLVEGFALMLEPVVDKILKSPCADNASRSGSWHALGSYEIYGFQFVGYCYDFAYNFMNTQQQENVRRVISKSTKGRIMHGMDLPPHWRYWNWMNCGTCFILLALSIEGEEGYDARVYKCGVNLVKDYLTYGFSEAGSSTEAVGYTAFGWAWGIETMMAMARRGSNLFHHSHFRMIKNWHLHTLLPWGNEWQSHGDGGDGGPGMHFIQAMKYFYPEDPVIDYLWKNCVFEGERDNRKGAIYILPALICAEDGKKDGNGQLLDYKYGEEFNQSNTFFDEERGSLVTRSEWSKDAMLMQFECRVDTVSTSHEHSDRGNFTMSALGRKWVVENSAGSSQGKYHNCVLIDGKGQGFFAPPGNWIDTIDQKEATFGICDAKNAYDWFWPKTIVATTELDDPRLKLERFCSAKQAKNLFTEIRKFKDAYKDYNIEKDPTPNVAKFYEGYDENDPRIWDEDSWPVRLKYNPVIKAFRAAGLIRGNHNYSIIVDDIQKDDKEHLYEWIMMTPVDIELLDMKDNDLILGNKDETETGSPRLLVRILQKANPGDPAELNTKPDARLESFGIERVSAFGDISYIMSKRLVIGSRAVAPDFKIMLVPFREGEELPVSRWNDDFTKFQVEWKDQKDELSFVIGTNKGIKISMSRNGVKFF